MKRVIALAILSVYAVACNGGSENRKAANDFLVALEAGTGSNYTLVKATTNKPGFAVFHNESTNTYEAYNVSRWNGTTMTSYSDYLAVSFEGVDIVRNLTKTTDYDSYYSAGCECDIGTVTDYYIGGGFKFDNTSVASRDLDTVAALKESAAKEFVSLKLKSEFSLSSNRADELANLAVRYQRMESVRELTQGEKDQFAMKSLGVSQTQIEKAMKSRAQGNDRDYAALLQTAAKVNKTTPEQIGRFLNEYADAL